MGCIEKFMWGYQRHFYVIYRSFAERVFNSLMPGLFDQVYVLGILAEGKTGRHQICIEQENDEISQDMFSLVKEKQSKFEEALNDKAVIHSDPDVQEDYNKEIAMTAWREAIKECNKSLDESKNRETFVSASMRMEMHDVYLVLQLDKRVYDSLPKFSKDKTKIGNLHFYTSILNALVPLFFTTVRKELNWDSFPMDLTDVSEKDLIRKAGKSFVDSLSFKCDHYLHPYVLCDSLNEISKTKYESMYAFGSIVFSPENHTNVKKHVTFKNPIPIEEHRLVRKALELTDDSAKLLCDGFCIYGLGEIVGEYDSSNEDLFVINFTDYYKWELEHAGEILLIYEYCQPFLPVSDFEKEYFSKKVKQALHGNVSDNQIAEMHFCILNLIQAKKGAVLVFGEKQKIVEEVGRLGSQAILPEVFRCDENIIRKMASIDGAIFLDFDCNCYAMGIILDGMVGSKGTPARGSRFNSSVRYYETNCKQADVFIIVISEDGMVNFIPELKLKEFVDSLLQMAKELSEQENVNIDEYNKTFDIIHAYSVYFNKEQCDFLNNLKKQMKERIHNKQPDSLVMPFDDLIPAFDFNENYFEENIL